MTPLAARLDETAARHPDAPAIVSGDRRLSWAQVAAESRVVARALLASGVRRGDHVAVWLPNRPEFLLLWMGAARIGAPLVPVNARYRSEEAADVLRRSDSMLLVSDVAAPMVAGLREVIELADWDAFRDRAAAIDDAGLTAAEAAPTPADHVIIVYTSGTTGHPKGVLHTHDVVTMADTVARWFGLGPEDRILGHMPLNHVAGAFSSYLLAMVSGAALVQMERWSAGEALALVASERVSLLGGIPTHFHDLLADPRLPDTDTSSLRTGWIGGAYIPPEVVDGAHERLGMEALLPVYGMTETTGFTTLGRAGDSRESLARGRGVPLGGYEVAVVDPTTRRPLASGTVGEVAVRGYVVMKGYYAEPAATSEVMGGDGWFHTGDLGRFDDDGYLTITGRLSDKFIVGGNNVHPADVERVLLDHASVGVAVVVPAPDPRLGEVGVAFLQATGGAVLDPDALRDYARENLAPFKVPRRFVIMQEWPMTSTGKIERAALQAMATQEAA